MNTQHASKKKNEGERHVVFLGSEGLDLSGVRILSTGRRVTYHHVTERQAEWLIILLCIRNFPGYSWARMM
jgi:hypothetical protein